MTSPEPMARATPRTACTGPNDLCNPPPQVNGKRQRGTVAGSRYPGSLRAVPGHPHCHDCRPRRRPGLLRIPAALAGPPPWGERARALLAPYGDPSRQKHYNYYDDQLRTHPNTSWRGTAGPAAMGGKGPAPLTCPGSYPAFSLGGSMADRLGGLMLPGGNSAPRARTPESGGPVLSASLFWQ
jgi:hypothetical protein